MLGRRAEKVPRFIWNTVGVVIYTVCALAGRNSLSEIFTNFLALMGYWVAIWIALTVEEQVVFRRRRGYDWEVWNKREKLPIGIAALIAFLVGWVGAILCMAQVWYIGPIAREVGEFGADVSFHSISTFPPFFTFLPFPPLPQFPCCVQRESLRSPVVATVCVCVCFPPPFPFLLWKDTNAMARSHYVQMGNYVGFCWAALVYPPLRWLELRRFKR